MDVPSEIRRSYDLFAAGRLDEAAGVAREVLAVSADEPSAHRVLAGVFLRRGDLEQAVSSARRAYEIDSTVPEAAANLAAVLVAAGEGGEAELMARRAIELDAEFVSGWVNLGLACGCQKRPHDAAEAFRRAVDLQPGHYGAWTNLGNVLIEMGEYVEAADCSRRALSIRPGLAGTENNLGNALLKLGQLDESIAAYHRSLAISPRDLETRYNLGIALEHAGRLSESEAMQRGVLESAAGHARATNNLGVVLKLQGRLAEAAEQFERARELSPDSTAAVANRLATMLCRDDVSTDEILAAHRQSSLELWGDLESSRSSPAQARSDRSPLRVGFVSPDFGQHPVGRFLLGAFESFDTDRVQAVCFSDRVQVDAFTDRFRSASAEWFDIRGREDEQVAEWIGGAGIDVLVDLAGHTGHHRLGVFARRPAPLQLTWIGYPSTTGLDAIDVLVADEVLVPEGAEVSFSEEVVRLEGGHISYLPAVGDHEVVARPESDEVVFGSFNKLDKTTPAVLATWAEVLQGHHGSRLVLRSRGLDDPQVADRVIGILGDAGLESDRIECHGWVSHTELLAGYGEIDIGLDPFPFCGGLTTCEALWMGVPVVTWAGDRMCGRQSAAFLARVGLEDLVASSREDYVARAVGLAEDAGRRGVLRDELRGRVTEGPLGDGRRLALEFTSMVERAWRERDVV
jgi:predicted O-linked N-acetylglucosamine transferase (SPINDLY family)